MNGRARIPPSVEGERRAEESHAVLLEDGGDRCSIGRPVAGERTQLLLEPMATAGRVDNDDLTGLISEVEERVAALFEKAQPGIVTASAWPPRADDARTASSDLFEPS